VVTCIAPLTLAIEQTDISQSEAFVAKQGQVTPASTVASIKPATAANGRAKSIVLSDVDGAPVKGGKAVFIPSSGGCNAATPDTAIGDDGKGTFTIAGQPGSYKLCYQAPGQTDSIEQTPVSGTLSLTLVQATTVSVEHVTEMHPMTITVNVQTDIKFPEAGPGDLAYFVNTATADCTKQVPPTQVGLKHNLFRITSTGTYALCYRTPGAPEAVAQANVSLKVIPQGVKEVMVNQWVRKDGAVDCTSLKLVSHCGFTPLQTECENAYFVDGGKGYRCFWETSGFPDSCQGDITTLDASKICKAETCGGSPSICWNPTDLEGPLRPYPNKLSREATSS